MDNGRIIGFLVYSSFHCLKFVKDVFEKIIILQFEEKKGLVQ